MRLIQQFFRKDGRNEVIFFAFVVLLAVSGCGGKGGEEKAGEGGGNEAGGRRKLTVINADQTIPYKMYLINLTNDVTNFLSSTVNPTPCLITASINPTPSITSICYLANAPVVSVSSSSVTPTSAMVQLNNSLCPDNCDISGVTTAPTTAPSTYDATAWNNITKFETGNNAKAMNVYWLNMTLINQIIGIKPKYIVFYPDSCMVNGKNTLVTVYQGVFIKSNNADSIAITLIDLNASGLVTNNFSAPPPPKP